MSSSPRQGFPVIRSVYFEKVQGSKFKNIRIKFSARDRADYIISEAQLNNPDLLQKFGQANITLIKLKQTETIDQKYDSVGFVITMSPTSTSRPATQANTPPPESTEKDDSLSSYRRNLSSKQAKKFIQKELNILGKQQKFCQDFEETYNVQAPQQQQELLDLLSNASKLFKFFETYFTYKKGSDWKKELDANKLIKLFKSAFFRDFLKINPKFFNAQWNIWLKSYIKNKPAEFLALLDLKQAHIQKFLFAHLTPAEVFGIAVCIFDDVGHKAFLANPDCVSYLKKYFNSWHSTSMKASLLLTSWKNDGAAIVALLKQKEIREAAVQEDAFAIADIQSDVWKAVAAQDKAFELAQGLRMSHKDFYRYYGEKNIASRGLLNFFRCLLWPEVQKEQRDIDILRAKIIFSRCKNPSEIEAILKNEQLCKLAFSSLDDARDNLFRTSVLHEFAKQYEGESTAHKQLTFRTLLGKYMAEADSKKWLPLNIDQLNLTQTESSTESESPPSSQPLQTANISAAVQHSPTPAPLGFPKAQGGPSSFGNNRATHFQSSVPANHAGDSQLTDPSRLTVPIDDKSANQHSCWCLMQ